MYPTGSPNVALGNIHKVREDVLNCQRMLQHSDRDTFLHTLVLSLATALTKMQGKVDIKKRCFKNAANSIEQALDTQDSILTGLLDKLEYQHEALRWLKL